MLNKYTQDIKVNVAFGFILRDRVTDQLKFYHPSNNNMMFETPKTVRQPGDVIALLEDFEKTDILDYCRVQRPNTKWIVDRVICVRIEIFKIV